MSQPLTREEAEQALASIESSKAAIRSAVRARRGHVYLWLWGAIWIVMALLAQFRGAEGVAWFPWLSLGGMIASFAIGFLQGRQIRTPMDRRFIRVLVTTLVFGAVWATVLRGPATPEAGFAFGGLLVAQAYLVAGFWFDSYFLWLGLVIAAAMLAGLFFFTGFFWIWVAVAGGGTLIGTGYYVRYFMR